MKGKKLLTLFASICLVLVLAALLLGCAKPAPPAAPAAAPAPEVIKWRFETLQTPGFAYKVNELFCELVGEMSNGRMEVTLYPPGSLYPIAEALDAVAAGMSEMALPASAYFLGKLGPITQVEASLPGVEKDPIERYNFFYEHEDGAMIKLMREVFAPHGVYYLGPNISTGWNMFSKVPINKVEDWSGLKVRCYGIEADWYGAMGASTILIPGGELYTALATGVVDAARWGSPSVTIDMGLHEVAKYILYPPSLPCPNNHHMINLDAWNALPDDIKAIVDAAARESGWFYVSAGSYRDYAALEKMKEEGAIVCKIPEDEQARMDKIAMTQWEKLAEVDAYAARGVELVKSYLRYLGRL